MPIGPARMPLLDHLGELRRRLTIVVMTLVVMTLIMYLAAPVIIDLLTEPIAHLVRDGEFLHRNQNGCGGVHAYDFVATPRVLPAGPQA